MIEEQKKNKIEMVQNIFLGSLGLGLIIKIFIPVFEYVMDIAAVGLVTTLLYKATLEKHTGKAFLYSLLLLLIFILIFTQRMN
ncbi:hypothetical protein QA538_08030 [Macrococcus sp. CCM 2573]